MVVGFEVTETDKLPFDVDGDTVEWLSEFPYPGSLGNNGMIDLEMKKQTASASRAFRTLRNEIFKHAHLSVNTKRHVHRACMLVQSMRIVCIASWK